MRRADTGSGYGPWEEAAMAIDSNATLENQPERTQLEYRVIAINEAGKSIPSTSVAAVL